MNIRLPTTP